MVLSSDVEKDFLHDWIEENTHALDVVASWESLCETYRVLEFNDPISDSVKLEEFKWIVAQMNKFLSKMRKLLMSCKDVSSTLKALEENVVPTGQVNLEGRKQLAYQKLRQRWVSRMASTLTSIMEPQEGETDG